MKSIFISSTFKDMQAERDSLHQNVFPKIRKVLNERGDDVQELDLRWGVDTTVMSEEESGIHVIETCMDAIDQCKPYVVVLLGDRYGWIPDMEIVKSVHDDRLSSYYEPDSSITHLEIIYGSTKLSSLDHCVFCFRDQSFADDVPEEIRGIYCAESDEHRKKLDDLKSQILGKSDAKLITYKPKWDKEKGCLVDLEDFNAAVEQAILEMIDEEPMAESALSKEATIIREASVSARRHLSNYVYNQKMSEFGAKCVFGNRGQWLIGEVGSGKSAFLASVAINAKRVGKVPFLYYGGNPGCESADTFLDTLRFFLAEDNADKLSTEDTRSKKLGDIKAMLSQLEDVVLLIDALDQMDEDILEIVCNMYSWGTPFLVTSLPEYRYAHNDVVKDIFQSPMQIPLLSKVNIENLVEFHAKQRGKSLDSKVYLAIHKKESSKNPLYLSLLLQRLFMMDKEEFAKADMIASGMEGISSYMVGLIESMPDDVAKLATFIIDAAVERSAKAGLLSAVDFYDFLSLMAVTPGGVKLREYEKIMESKGRSLPIVAIERLLYFLYDAFGEDSKGNWNYKHRILREAILGRCNQEKLQELQHSLFDLYIGNEDYVSALKFVSYAKDENAVTELVKYCLDYESIPYEITRIINGLLVKDSPFVHNSSRDKKILILRATLNDFDLVFRNLNLYSAAILTWNFDDATQRKDKILYEYAKMLISSDWEGLLACWNTVRSLYGEGDDVDIEEHLTAFYASFLLAMKGSFHVAGKELLAFLWTIGYYLADKGKQIPYDKDIDLHILLLGVESFTCNREKAEEEILSLANMVTKYQTFPAGLSEEMVQNWPIGWRFYMGIWLNYANLIVGYLVDIKKYKEAYALYADFCRYTDILEAGIPGYFESLNIAEMHTNIAKAVSFEYQKKYLTNAEKISKQLISCGNNLYAYNVMEQLTDQSIDYKVKEIEKAQEAYTEDQWELVADIDTLMQLLKKERVFRTKIGRQDDKLMLQKEANYRRKCINARFYLYPWSMSVRINDDNGESIPIEKKDQWYEAELEKALKISIQDDGDSAKYIAIDTRYIAWRAIRFYTIKQDERNLIPWVEKMLDACTSINTAAKNKTACNYLMRLAEKLYHFGNYEYIEKCRVHLLELDADEMYLAFPSAVKSYKDGNVDEALAWIEKIDGNPDVSMVGLALKFKIAYEDYDNLQAMNIADEMYKLGCKISNENLVWKMERYLLWYEWYKAKICLHKDLKRIVSHMKSDLTHFGNEHPDNADAAKMPLFLGLARSIDHFSSEDLDFILLENRENRRKVLYDAAKKKLEESYENASVIERLDLLYKCIGEAGNESGVIEQYRGRILEMCIDILLDDANDLEPKELLILFKEFNIGYDVLYPYKDKLLQIIRKTLSLDVEEFSDTQKKNLALNTMNIWIELSKEKTISDELLTLSESVEKLVRKYLDGERACYVRLGRLNILQACDRNKEYLDELEKYLTGPAPFKDKYQEECLIAMHNLETKEGVRAREVRKLLADNHDNWRINIMYYMDKVVREYPKLSDMNEVEARVVELYEKTKNITI